MPTLVRLLSLAVLLVGAVVAIMVALVAFVEPRQGQIVVEVPVPALERSAATASAQAPDTAPTGSTVPAP